MSRDAPTEFPIMSNRHFPVAIGGVGGSGTRVVAGALAAMGYEMGADRNESEDNLWFTLLFKRRSLFEAQAPVIAPLFRLFERAMSGQAGLAPDEAGLIDRLAEIDRLQHPADWLRERAETFKQALEQGRPDQRPWGWKEPNTHVLIDRLLVFEPRLRYLHVIRHGIDMALSSNQNQLRFWGGEYLERAEITPANSLKYWVLANRRILDLQREHHRSIICIRFEDLCRDPAQVLSNISAFLCCPMTEETRRAIEATIDPPDSIGRYRDCDLGQFDPDDLAVLPEFGYEV